MTPLSTWYDLNLWRKREELLAAHAETAKPGTHTEGNLWAQGAQDINRKRA
jgi:hypothetical protein